MNVDKQCTLLRCLITWLAATLAASAVIDWAAPDLLSARDALLSGFDDAAFDTWLVRLSAGVIAGCAAWAWLVTSVVVVEAVTRRRVAPTKGVPRWARRLVLGACGVVMLGATAPAMAAQAHPQGQPDTDGTQPSSLHGLPLPDRAEGRSVSDVVVRAIADSPPSAPTDQRGVRIRVQPGDSLWTIARAALREAGATATSVEVAAYWPRVYALNRDVVGPDPDLLRPGQVLRLAPLPTSTPTSQPTSQPTAQHGKDLR